MDGQKKIGSISFHSFFPMASLRAETFTHEQDLYRPGETEHSIQLSSAFCHWDIFMADAVSDEEMENTRRREVETVVRTLLWTTGCLS